MLVILKVVVYFAIEEEGPRIWGPQGSGRKKDVRTSVLDMITSTETCEGCSYSIWIPIYICLIFSFDNFAKIIALISHYQIMFLYLPYFQHIFVFTYLNLKITYKQSNTRYCMRLVARRPLLRLLLLFLHGPADAAWELVAQQNNVPCSHTRKWVQANLFSWANNQITCILFNET